MITAPTSKRPKAAYHHGDLRTALIEAGLAILSEGGGPAALSLREAARRAGVSAMAPYRHFADKEALLAALATVGFQRFGAALRDADAAPEPRDALQAQGIAYVRFALENPALFRLMFGADQPHRSEDCAAAADASFKVMAERTATLPEPDPAHRALANWALVHGLAMLALDGKLARFGRDPIGLAEHVIKAL